MTNLSQNFNGLAAANPAKKKYPPPFSLRFTQEERARLDAECGNKPLSVHIREQLFGDDAAPRKRQGNSPVGDTEALGRDLLP